MVIWKAMKMHIMVMQEKESNVGGAERHRTPHIAVQSHNLYYSKTAQVLARLLSAIQGRAGRTAGELKSKGICDAGPQA